MLAIQEADLTELHRYWDATRVERVGPMRAEMDMAALKPLLGRIVLVETAPRIEDFRIRLQGTLITAEFGEERTGWTYDRLSHVEGVAEVYRAYWTTYADAVPHYETFRTVSSLRSYRGYSRLLLPLSEDGRAVSMILAAFGFHDLKYGPR